MQGFVNAISDSSYAHPVDTAAKIHAMKSMTDVYVYHFGYRGKNSHTTLDINNYPPKVSNIDFLKVCTKVRSSNLSIQKSPTVEILSEQSIR